MRTWDVASAWGPFLKRPGNFWGPKTNFKIQTCWIGSTVANPKNHSILLLQLIVSLHYFQNYRNFDLECKHSKHKTASRTRKVIATFMSGRYETCFEPPKQKKKTQVCARNTDVIIRFLATRHLRLVSSAPLHTANSLSLNTALLWSHPSCQEILFCSDWLTAFYARTLLARGYASLSTSMAGKFHEESQRHALLRISIPLS